MKFKLSILIILALTGCSIPKEQFDCKYGVGLGCKSITEVNQMVNDGALGGRHPNPKPQIAVSKNVTNLIHEPMVVQRVTEEHLRVWLAPFQDEQGCFHEGEIIHTVLRPGFWQVGS